MVVTTWMILSKSSTLREFADTFNKAVLPLGNFLLAISEGSLCFTVQAQTTLALEALWKTYQDGTLERKLQEFLITDEIKQLVGSEVKLTVKIDEEEYKNASRDLIVSEKQGNSSYNLFYQYFLASCILVPTSHVTLPKLGNVPRSKILLMCQGKVLFEINCCI